MPKPAQAIVWRIWAPIYLFVGFLAILHVEPRAPTSQSKLYPSPKNPFLIYTPPPFLSFFSLFLYSHSIPFCVYYLISFCQPLFPLFSMCSSQHLSQCFSQCFSANPLFAFFSLFYSLSLVGHSSLSFHQFTRIFTFARIPRNHHAF